MSTSSFYQACSQGQALGQDGPAPGAGIVGPCIKAGCQAGLDSQEERQLGEASGTVSRGDGSGTVIYLSWLGSSPAILGCRAPYLVWQLAASHTGSLCLPGLTACSLGKKGKEETGGGGELRCSKYRAPESALRSPALLLLGDLTACGGR